VKTGVAPFADHHRRYDEWFERQLPQAQKERRKYSLCALGAGILVAVAVVLSK